jgi:hypothetical protein
VVPANLLATMMMLPYCWLPSRHKVGVPSTLRAAANSARAGPMAGRSRSMSPEHASFTDSTCGSLDLITSDALASTTSPR